MNPEAEKLWEAMWYAREWRRTGSTHQQWLQDNADTVAELVDAAMDVSWQETADNPDAYPLAGEEVDQFLHEKTGRNQAADALRRLARAVVDFKGPQGPPEPEVGLICPEPSCVWWVAKDQGSLAKYQDHYRTWHLGGKP